MASEGGIVGWVARLHPLLALIAVFGVIVVAEISGFAAAAHLEPDVYPPDSIAYRAVTTAFAILFYTGYPIAISVHVRRTHGPVTQVRPPRVAIALFAMVAAHVTGMMMAIGLLPGEADLPGFAIAEGVMVSAGLAGPLYIMWTAARGLVQAETGQAVPLSRLIGTFIMFFILPFAIYFLQRRVRRLAAGETATTIAFGRGAAKRSPRERRSDRAMAQGGGIVGWIARLHPLLALVAVIGGIVLGRVVGIVAAWLIEPDVFAPVSALSVVVGTPVAVVFVIGYPVAVAIHVLRTHGPVTRVRPMGIAAALLVMLPAFATAMVFFASPGSNGTGFAIAVTVAVFVWLAGLFYILWTAARGLVQAERGRTTLDRVIGTFFMFYLLPLGIYFLQRRVRRLATGGIPPQAA